MEDNCLQKERRDTIYNVDINCPSTGGALLEREEIQNKLFNIVEKYDRLMYIIDNFNQREDNCPIDVIEVKNGLQIDFDKSEVIKTTIRMDKDIWERFSGLCKDKYKHLNKHDIISKAFEEFIQKYK